MKDKFIITNMKFPGNSARNGEKENRGKMWIQVSRDKENSLEIFLNLSSNLFIEIQLKILLGVQKLPT